MNKVLCREQYSSSSPSLHWGVEDETVHRAPLHGGKLRPRVQAIRVGGCQRTDGKGVGRMLRNVMKLAECVIDRDVYLVICFNKSKPDAGVFFSNNYFKCDSALYIFFEWLLIIHHIFTWVSLCLGLWLDTGVIEIK